MRGVGRPLTRDEVEQLAVTLRRWLDLIAAGEMDASSAMGHRLEGAELALRAALGEPLDLRSLTIEERLL
jgi:hypothetical protein